MLKCKKKIWLENISELFCSSDIIPIKGTKLESQINALTRLLLVLFVILILCDFKNSVLLLILSLLFIIILYYIQRNTMEQYKAENFCQQISLQQPKYPYKKITHTNVNPNQFKNLNKNIYCGPPKILEFNNPNYISSNQRLVGPPNPKTFIPPVIVPPSTDLDYWKTNNLVSNSYVNNKNQIDVYKSGYQVSTCCGDVSDKYLVPVKNQNPKITTLQSAVENDKENFELPYIKSRVLPEQPGEINISCGYNPKQLETAAIPANYPTGHCEQDPVFKNYNKNLYTQTIQPGVYSRSEVNEPINSNIGISFTQQLPPLTCKTTPDGGVLYVENDPRLIEPVIESNGNCYEETINESNIYDPRHTGYGTSYRAYTDDLTGQTRFYYDDIDSIKMPNYITRSNIDFAPYADSYGPQKQGDEFGNKYNSEIRALANDSFLRSTIQQRTSLQESLLRKYNARNTQLRQAPIRTGAQCSKTGGT